MKNYFQLNISVFGILALLGCMPASAALITNPAQAITQTVTIQPIIVSDNSGGNTANFFGTLTQQVSIEGLIDDIWAQAGIDVNFLAPSAWNNTFANWGAGGAPNNGNNRRPSSDLSTIRNNAISAGVAHANSNVINMFFVNIPAGFDLLSTNQAAGLAFISANGITQYVGSNLLGFLGGQEAIAGVVAHEIGHNLGLNHLNEFENLMQSGGVGDRLNSIQIAIALRSNLSVVTAIPLPTALWFFSSGLLGLISISKSRKLNRIFS